MARRLLALMAVALAAACASAPPPGSASRAFDGLEGCFLLIDARTGRRLGVEQTPGACARRLPACSTFKVALAAMAFDAGILADESSGYPWDGTRYPIEPWNRDHTAATWMRDSVVWFSQRLTPLLGAERMGRYLADFDYGSRDLSAGLTSAWLTVAPFAPDARRASLTLSPEEQARFLARLWRGELKVSPRALELTRKITDLGETPGGYRLHGKTGSGFVGSPEGRRIGWFVAHLAKGEEEFVSVVAFTDVERKAGAPAYAGRQAREMMGELLRLRGKW